MARVKSLNIYNTDRKYNANLIQRKEIEEKVKVTPLNEEEIEKEMDDLAKQSKRIPKKNDTEYIIYQDKYQNDRLIEKIIKHGGQVSYYTTTVVPYWVIEALSHHSDSEVIYSLRKEFSRREIDNVHTAFKATKVIIDIPIVIPDINPNEVLLALEPLKTSVDDVQLNFPPLLPKELKKLNTSHYSSLEGGKHYCKSSSKFQYMKYVQTPLSIWAMNLYIVCDSQDDHDNLYWTIEEDLVKRNPNYRKKIPAKKKEAYQKWKENDQKQPTTDTP